MASKKPPPGSPATPGANPSSGRSGGARQQARDKARDKAAALRAEEARRARRRSLLIQLGVVAVVALVAVGITVGVLKARDDADAAAEAPAGFDANGAIFVGATDPDVTVTIVEDFACPHCRAFEAEAQELLESYASGDQVRLEYRPVAFLDRVSTDEYSSRALNAAACVVQDDPANWSAMHRLLYAEQPAEGGPGLSDTRLVDLAVQAGADQDAVSACIEDRTFAGWVRATTDRTTGESFFQGTPTILVAGTKVEPLSLEAVRAAVDAELEK